MSKNETTSISINKKQIGLIFSIAGTVSSAVWFACMWYMDGIREDFDGFIERSEHRLTECERRADQCQSFIEDMLESQARDEAASRAVESFTDHAN